MVFNESFERWWAARRCGGGYGEQIQRGREIREEEELKKKMHNKSR